MELSGVNKAIKKAHKPLPLTTAIGSLLRVAARLNFLTCVFFSMALAKSFRVGIGMFWKTNKDTLLLVQGYYAHDIHTLKACVSVYLNVVEVDLC